MTATLHDWEQCVALKQDGQRCTKRAGDWRAVGIPPMCKQHHLRAIYGASPEIISDAQRANDLHTAGADRFGFLWLGIHVEVSAVLRRTRVFDGEAPANLRLAACQIAWQWCEDLAVQEASTQS